MNQPYKYKDCQSLFGYAEKVHKRSGGICQLCDAGKGEESNFDLWRQLTVEHIVGKSQGGYPKEIESAIDKCFPEISSYDKTKLVCRIDEANTITACSFCNSMTSRYRSDKVCSDEKQANKLMEKLITEVEGTPEEVVKHIVEKLEEIKKKKRKSVHWKLDSIRDQYRKSIKPELDQHPDRSKNNIA